MLAPWKKCYDQPRQHIKKQRHYFVDKVHLVKAMVFPMVMYGCESWTIKKAECWITDTFELWCWRRFLRVPWTAKRPNESILKEISPEYSLEELMMKLKLPFFGHLMGRTSSLEKDPDAQKDWRQEAKGTTVDEMVGWHHWLDGHEFEQALGADRKTWHAAVHEVSRSLTQLYYWTELCMGQGIYNIITEHIVLPESKSVTHTHAHIHTMIGNC